MKRMFYLLIVISLSLSIAKTQDVKDSSQSKTLYSGIINISGSEFDYPLFGFVNIAYSEENGLMLGFVNWSNRNMLGAQIGYFNIVKREVNGGQFGFLNIAKNVSGLQLGFVNYSDSISSGLALGFISINRRNGYQAFDLSFNSFGGGQFSLKTGLKKCYTSIGFENPTGAINGFGWALGIGYVKDISEKFHVNPELRFIDSYSSNHLFATMNLKLGYSIANSLDLYLGPLVLWYFGRANDISPKINLKQVEINDKNSLFMGLSLSLRYAFKWS